jgi:signal transduction histidine kinase
MVLQSALLVDQLKDLIRKRDLFLEDVAHDIRAPIQNMIFQSALLKRGAVPERDYPRWAGKIATQARRLHMVSKRVWAMAALDKGTALKESPQKVSVSEIVHEHRASLEAVAAARNVEIWVDPVLSDWAPIMVHKELFSQTVLNLLDNGVKYSSRHTQVRIDGKWSRERVRLSFVSRGIPVPEDEKEHIFERYYRTSLARSIVPAGTGIGLYIAKKFADHYGGIEVYSEPVQGTDDYVTEFRLYINQRR